MKKPFPYLNTRNVARLFSREKQSLINEEDSIEVPAPTAGSAHHLPFTLNDFSKELFKQIGSLMMDSLKAPCVFVCTHEAEIVWEDSQRPFKLSSIHDDITRQLTESKDDDIASFSKLVPYPKGVKTDPADGIVRFGAIMPLRASDEVIGALCFVDDNERRMTPSLNKRFKNAGTLLINYLSLKASEERTLKEEAAIRSVQEIFFKRSGTAFLGLLTKKIAEVLEVEWVFVTEQLPAKREITKTLAVTCQGASVENFNYSLQGSPLEGIATNKFVAGIQAASEKYSEDSFLKKNKISGFAGISLINAEGKVCGYLVAADTKPLKNIAIIRGVFKALSGRVAAEVAFFSGKKKAEAELANLQRRFDALFNNGTMGCCATSAKGFFKRMNNVMLERLGYRWGELRMKRHTDITDSKDHEQEARLRKECLDGKRQGFDLEKRFVCKEGSIFWGKIHVTLLNSDNPDEILFLEVLEDFTEVRQIRQDLKSISEEKVIHESRFESIKHSAHLPIVILDNKAKIIECNQVFAKIIGLDVKEIEKTSFTSLLGIKESKDIKALDDCLKGHTTSQVFKHKVEIKTGKGKTTTRKQINFSLTSVHNEEDKLDSILVTAQDITSELEKEQRASLLSTRYAAAVDHSPISLATLDQDFETILSCNNSLETLLGWSEQEFTHKKVSDIVSDENKVHWTTTIEEFRSSERHHCQIECKVSQKDKAPRPVRLSLTALRKKNKIIGGILTFEDNLTLETLDIQLSRQVTASDEAFQASPNGQFILNLEGKFQAVNPAFANMVLRTTEELKKLGLTDVLAESDFKKIQTYLKEVSKSKKGRLQKEISLLTAENEKRTCNLTIRAIQDKEGGLIHILGIAEDLSPIKGLQSDYRNLQGLYELEASKLNILLKSATSGLIIANNQGIIIHSNNTAESLLGHAHLSGKKLNDILKTEKAKIQEQIGHCLAGKRHQFKWEQSSKDQKFKDSIISIHLSLLGKGDQSFYIVELQDVSDFKKQEAALKASDTPVQSALELHNMGLLFISKDGLIEQTNQSFVEMLAITKEEVLGKAIDQILVGESFSKQWQEYVKEKKDKLCTNLHIEGLDGKKLFVVLTLECIRDQHHETQYFILLVDNRTESFLDKNSLKNKSEQLDKLFNHPTLTVALTNDTGNFLRANHSFLSLLGYTSEELRFKTWDDLIHPGDSPIQEDEWNKLNSGDHPFYEIEKRFEGKSGQTIWGRLNLSRITFNNLEGPTSLTVSILTDLSKIRQLEKSNKKTEAHLSAVFEQEATPAMILNGSNHILKSNRLAQKLFSDNALELSDHSLLDYISENDRKSLDKLLLDCHEKTRDAFRIEASFVIHEQLIPVQLTGSLIKQEGLSDWSVVLMIEDLSQIKQLQAELETEHEDKQSLGEELQDRKTTIISLESSLEDHRKQLEETQSQIKELEKQLAEENNSHSETTSKLQETRHELEEMKSSLSETTETLNETITSLEKSENYLSEKEESLKQAKENISQLEQDLTDINNTLDETKIELDAKHVALDSANQDLKKSEASLETERTIAKDLERQIQELNTTIESSQEEQSQLHQELASTNERTRELENRLSQKTDTIESHEVSLNQSTAELDKTKLRIAELENALEKSNAQIREHESELEAANTNNIDLENRLSDRKETLESQKSALTNLIEQWPVPIFILDEEGQASHVNRKALEWTGYDNAEEIHMNALFIAEEGVDEKELRTKCWHDELEQYQADGALVKKNTQATWARVHGFKSSILDDSKIICLMEDLSKLNEAKTIADDAETRFIGLASSSIMGVALTNAEDEIVFANQTFAHWLGKSRDSLLQRKLNQFHSKGFIPTNMDQASDLLSGKLNQYVTEIHWESPVTSALKTRCSINAVRSGDGSIWCKFYVFEQIQESQTTTETENFSTLLDLQVAETRLSTLFGSVDYPSAMLDNQGRFMEANSALSTLFQFQSEEDWKGRKFSELAVEGAKSAIDSLQQKLESKLRTEVQIEDKFINQENQTFSAVLKMNGVYTADAKLECIFVFLEKRSPNISPLLEGVTLDEANTPPPPLPSQGVQPPPSPESESKKNLKLPLDVAKNLPLKSFTGASSITPFKLPSKKSKSSEADKEALKQETPLAEDTPVNTPQKTEFPAAKSQIVNNNKANPNSEAFLTADHNGRISLMNLQASDLLGCDYQDCIGKELSEVYHVLNQKQIHLEGAASSHILLETSIRHTSGGKIDLIQSTQPLMDISGELKGTAIIFRDTESLNQLEEELTDKGQIKNSSELNTYIANIFNKKLIALSSTAMEELPELQKELSLTDRDNLAQKNLSLINKIEERLYLID
ncbi:MAG: PAS domain S-box protein [Verrucomicrobiota bacterium]